jgi:hypothetical protein
MPRSKLKNGKSNRESNGKLKRSKKTRASKLKLRNKCGGAGSGSPDGNGRKFPRSHPHRMASRFRFKRNRVSPARHPPSPTRRSPSPQRFHAKRDGDLKAIDKASARRRSPSPASRSKSASRSPSPSHRRSKAARPASRSRSSRSASNNAGNTEGFLRILQGPMAKSVFGNLTSQQLARLQEVSRHTQSAVKTFYPTSSDIRYKNLIDIYDNPKFKRVLEKIKQIDPEQINYLQNTEKLKEIQEVYKNKKKVVKEDKIKRINELITIFFKYFNMYKPKIRRKIPNLENYMNYLREKSSKFDKHSKDINKDIAILTLFYGFSDNILGFIFNYTVNKSEILNDYIYLLNELFTKHTGKKFYTQFELISSVPGVANKLNREGINKYVNKITASKEPHAEVFKELKENSKFLRKDN